ncbi:MAG TPA: carbon starvation protein A [Jiangellaceae bacterium]
MPAILVAVTVIALFALGYIFYSRYLATKVYALDPAFVTPAHEFADGVDYVPTNKHVLFGHHFVSVAGAAPIVGPAIAVFWGWVPALLWITFGTIFASGAHDFGALVVSVRHKAKNIGTLASEVISKRSRILFLLIIFFLVTLVNAVFAVVIGILFVNFPAAVIPIFVEIPLAIAIGQYIYRTRTPALVPSLVALIVLYFFIWVGNNNPVEITGFADSLGMDPRTVWIIIMFAYTFIAAQLPVWLLLQPRDYINSHQLFVALGVAFLGVLIGLDQMDAPAFNTNIPEGQPSIFPFLFITIACGAVSGFHSLVSSGTTSKQLDKETDARHVAYLGSLGEGTLALASVLAVSAGVTAALNVEWEEIFPDYGTASGGAVGNFVNGIAHFASNLGIEFGLATAFAAVVVVSFAATTMDTGVRLQRYIVQEIATIANWRWLSRTTWAATAVAVLLPLGLALMPSQSDQGFAFGTLWRLFGTTNQLTAGLALTVVMVWLLRNNRNPLAVIIPAAFLLVMTIWALIVQVQEFADADEWWILVPLDLIILALSIWLLVEAAIRLRSMLAERRTGVTAEAEQEEAEQ